jgi:hypothetical protein
MRLVNVKPVKSEPLGLGSFPFIPKAHPADNYVSTCRDAKLLSFGTGGEEEAPVTFKKKPIFRPDRKLSMMVLLRVNRSIPLYQLKTMDRLLQHLFQRPLRAKRP